MQSSAAVRPPLELAPFAEQALEDDGLLAIGDPWRAPLPGQPRGLTRFLCRALTALARRSVSGISGHLSLLTLPDPFVVVANHNQRHEALLLPALLAFLRGGRLVHFLADWPNALIPGVGLLYRRGGVILVGGKSARWPVFDRLRPWLVDPAPAHERALAVLRAGRSVGVFPEGTMNRRPDTLLRGRTGAAALALDAGVPLLPIGLRFPGRAPGASIPDGAAMALAIGAPILPPEPGDDRRAALHELHQRVMSALAGLSGKSWSADAPRRKSHAPQTDRRQGR